jgi:hypothetical protein
MLTLTQEQLEVQRIINIYRNRCISSSSSKKVPLLSMETRMKHLYLINFLYFSIFLLGVGMVVTIDAFLGFGDMFVATILNCISLAVTIPIVVLWILPPCPMDGVKNIKNALLKKKVLSKKINL